MSRTLTISDRAAILKLADECADNKDGFGFAFYNASIVRFAIAVARLCSDEREWVGLTRDEVGDLSDFAYENDEEFVRNVEAKIKEKNQ